MPLRKELAQQKKLLLPLTTDTNKKNKKKYVDNGEFLSRELSFAFPVEIHGAKKAKLLQMGARKSVTRYGKIVAAKLVCGGYFRDNLKAPYYKSMKSAMLALQSLNCFLSKDKKLLENGHVERHCYGYLTATVTGLDDRNQRVYKVFPELEKMMDAVYAALCRSNYNVTDLELDMVSIKVYYRFYDPKAKKWITKILNHHTDVNFRPDGSSPKGGDNGQVPGSVVVIYHMGDGR